MAGVDTILSRLTRNTARATLKCSKCHFEFIPYNTFLAGSPPMQTIGVYRCKTCSKEFAKKYNFLRHLEKHKEVRQVFSCEICGATKTRKDHLKTHLFYVHNINPSKKTQWNIN
ncbi:hypothetical protein JTE90_027595 [Oedothorax gibbosus]|uniref:C2H2-type domain-containing protein n=1 Tax=Oedothorax gibbosus TaxID=931172 RepID=A0AAV6VLT9_9ARAC|nr:hypothetical protein JTE90_027595 [Oedothorax gibbosus]